jgi:hypothetical protein
MDEVKESDFVLCRLVECNAEVSEAENVVGDAQVKTCAIGKIDRLLEELEIRTVWMLDTL